MKTSIRELMAASGVGFGTSGARGLATAMTDLVCHTYTRGFLQYLAAIGEFKPGLQAVALAGDLRPSSGQIMEAASRAAGEMGARVICCGRIPSPALALFGLDRGIPSIMVTGSHIPTDRNGIKFNKPSGEFLKEDEQGMARQVVVVDPARFDAAGCFTGKRPAAVEESPEAGERYLARYLEFFDPNALQGMRIGVYQHSAVGRDLLVRVLRGLGAETVALGRSEEFIPVDTEAIRPEDAQLAQEWARQGRFDAIVSADGDSDRPLVSDERGRWLRGDVAGILCARYLEADSVCTPVSCNTAVEKSGWFPEVRRTRIGSPYVVAAMKQAEAAGARRAVGYEANGGFLLQSDVQRGGRILRALPTRDAVIVILGVLLLARMQGRKVSELAASLPARFTASDRLKDFPTERSREILARFNTGGESADREAIETVFGGLSGRAATVDRTDGLRVIFANEEVIHLRPSGNAPEFRCYSEADSEARARLVNERALDILRKLSQVASKPQ